MKTFSVTRTFTDGLLKGITITQTGTVYFPVGFHCAKSIGGDAYTIISCVEVAA